MLQKEEEKWKPIPEYDNYEISDMGRVRNRRGQILQPQKNNRSGHLQIVLWKDARAKCFYLRRLVAQVFIPNPDNFEYVGSIDNKKDNCKVNNLFWSKEKYEKKTYKRTDI